jgi:hypothetical protein
MWCDRVDWRSVAPLKAAGAFFAALEHFQDHQPVFVAKGFEYLAFSR